MSSTTTASTTPTTVAAGTQPQPTTTTPEGGPATESGTTFLAVSPAGPQRADEPEPAGTTVEGRAGPGSPGPATGHAMARQPERAVIVGGQQLTLAGMSSLQGRRSVIGLAEECNGTDRARIDGFELPVADVDTNPATFTLDAAGLGLGTRTITFDCGADVVAAFDLLVYRQNGAERGGANSVAIATAVGVASLLALFGLPTMLGEPIPIRRRDERPPPWFPPAQE